MLGRRSRNLGVRVQGRDASDVKADHLFDVRGDPVNFILAWDLLP